MSLSTVPGATPIPLDHALMANILRDVWLAGPLAPALLCAELGASELTVRVHVQALAAEGLLTVDEEFGVVAAGEEAQTRRRYVELLGPGAGACTVCHCTDDWGCEDGCWWAAPGLCSSCVAGPDVLTPGTQIQRVYAALSELPGVPMTSRELADETGLSLKFCSGYMYTLRAMGLAHSGPADPAQGHRRGSLVHWIGERR